MSEPKLISPLLDGFSMGDAISHHDGVRCCPALKEGSDKKYIVKIISIPASQVQLDALLQIGAYDDPTAALDYFKELADGVEKEAQCLKNLSRLDGFLAYEGWQVVPMDRSRLGYEVYLLSHFRHSLEKFMRRNPMTHLGAVNLGIDLCGALSAARRAGWIYADLKPSNIFISENREYRIGDLGLMELEGLDLASLPGKYRSDYTAPELQDELVSPNTTMDTYALGLILYQIFNDGKLPQVKDPTEDPLPPPTNADYEMAEILLKACAPKPADRYADPMEMGQALVAYMQRNTVNDVPILPPRAELTGDAAAAEAPRRDETLPGMNDEAPLPKEALSQEMAEMIDQADDLISHHLPAPPVAPEAASVEDLEAHVIQEAEEKKQARQLLEALTLEPADTEIEEDPQPIAPLDIPVAEIPQKPKKDKVSDLSTQRRKKQLKGILTAVLVLLILGGIAAGGYWFYGNYYVQSIDSLTVSGTENEMTILLDSDIDDSLLSIHCTDTYGNTKDAAVVNGQASFSELLPDMLYKIQVQIQGFHKLSGPTTHEYMTPAETRIVSYTAVTGPEDGSVILNFTVDGPDSEEWTAICSAEGQETILHTFTGHMATVKGLAIGQEYTISLVPSTDLYITNGDSLAFTASSLVIAQDLALTTSADGKLYVAWTVPENAIVTSWDVYCYSADGYEQRITTDELAVVFDGISTGSAYTVEVTAAGMTQAARAGITANPITISNIQVDDSDEMQLRVTWDYTGPAPEGGWLLVYTIDGQGQEQVVRCEENSGVISVRVPVATYDLTIQAADGSTVFQNTAAFKTGAAELYNNSYQDLYPGIHPHMLRANLLVTPQVEGWTVSNISGSDYTTTFSSGEEISVMLQYLDDFWLHHEDITVMYVIRNEAGKVLGDHIGIQNLDWKDDMWKGKDYHFCGLDIPSVPTEPGKYSLCLYFDGMAVCILEFTITA